MEQGRISDGQVAYLLYVTVIATSILIMPSIAGQQAGRDFWLSAIIAAVFGFWGIFIALSLNKLYPGLHPFEMFEQLLGSYLGKLLGIVYLFFFLHANALFIRQYAEFVITVFLPKTPVPAIIGLMAAVCALAVRGGIEVLARTAQLFLPISLIVWFGLLLITIPDWEFQNILPILEFGALPSLKGGFLLQTWYGEFIMLAFLIPFLSSGKHIKKYSLWALVGVIITFVLISFSSLLIFGIETTNFIYPFFEVIRYINVGSFFENIDALPLAFWILTIYLKISVFHYAMVYGTAHLLKLSDYRSLSLPLSLLLAATGLWIVPNTQKLIDFFSSVSPTYFTCFNTLLPSIVLLAAWIQRKVKG
ncbi:GerAB/ArcD/ProY family transporter [Paenibacillus campinasensis]|uniref:Endospore germination permease n=1 Tax=Paenibacillus campinasensis TaxID=66347 RepID=A0A268ESR7_9BACL|nr:endospore germination permease [Paenibacillus campinasensis]PAD76150.1 hypothetical protein CHH67_12935 [Paenibacillus campinasensis]